MGLSQEAMFTWRSGGGSQGAGTAGAETLGGECIGDRRGREGPWGHHQVTELGFCSLCPGKVNFWFCFCFSETKICSVAETEVQWRDLGSP